MGYNLDRKPDEWMDVNPSLSGRRMPIYNPTPSEWVGSDGGLVEGEVEGEEEQDERLEKPEKPEKRLTFGENSHIAAVLNNPTYAYYNVYANHPPSVVRNLLSASFFHGSYDYQNYQDERWLLPKYLPYMSRAAFVENDEQAEEMFAYFDEQIEFERRASEQGNVFLDLLVSIPSVDNFIPIFGGYRLAYKAGKLAKVAYFAGSSVAGTATSMALMSPLRREMTPEEIGTTFAVGLTIDAGIAGAAYGVRKLIGRYREGQARQDWYNKAWNFEMPVHDHDPFPAEWSGWGGDSSGTYLSPPLMMDKYGVKEVPIERLYIPTILKVVPEDEKRLVGKIGKAKDHLANVIGTPKEASARGKVEKLTEQLEKKQLSKQTGKDAVFYASPTDVYANYQDADFYVASNDVIYSTKGDAPDFYATSFDVYANTESVGNPFDYFSRSFEPIYDGELAEGEIAKESPISSEEKLAYKFMVAENAAVTSVTGVSPVTKELRDEILASEEGKIAVRKIVEGEPLLTLSNDPLGEMRRRFTADSIRKVIGVPEGYTIPVYFNAKTGKPWFNANAKPVRIVYGIEAIGGGVFRIRSNDGSLEGLELKPHPLPWDNDEVRKLLAEGNVSDSFWQALAENYYKYLDAEVANGGNRVEIVNEAKAKDSDDSGGGSGGGDTNYVTPDFNEQGESARIDLGTNSRWAREIFNFLVRTADKVTNFSPGSFLLYGITSDSPFARKVADMLFTHQFVLEASAKTGKPTLPSVSALIELDRKAVDLLINKSIREYYLLVDKLKKMGLVETGNPIELSFGNAVNKYNRAFGWSKKLVGDLTGGVRNPSSEAQGKAEDVNYTVERFSNDIYEVIVDVEGAIDKVPVHYRDLVESVAEAMRKGYETLADLQREVNLGNEAEPDTEYYAPRSWNPDSLNTEASFNDLVDTIEEQTRLYAQNKLEANNERMEEIQREIKALTALIEKSKSKHIRKISKEKIERLEGEIETISEKNTYYEVLAEGPDKLGKSHARNIADAQATRISKGKSLHEGIISGIDAFDFNEPPHIIKAGSQRYTSVAGDTKHYIKWLNTDAFNAYKRAVYTNGAVFQLLKRLQLAGFDDFKALIKGLNDEREEMLTIARNTYSGDKLAKEKRKIIEAYKEHFKYVLSATEHVLDRYKDTSGAGNNAARGIASFFATNSLNLVSLGTASDFFKTLADNGTLPALDVIFSSISRRLNNITKKAIQRADPEGVFVEGLVYDLGVSLSRGVGASVGREATFGDSTDSKLTEWMGKLAGEVNKLNFVEFLNQKAQSFSARVSIHSIMLMAEKVANGVRLSKRDDHRRLELGLSINDLKEFNDAWQSTGGHRRDKKAWWARKGLPDPRPELWDFEVGKRFFLAIVKSVGGSVFNADKGIQSIGLLKNNMVSLIGLFQSYASHFNSKVFAPALVALFKGDYRRFLSLVFYLGMGGAIHSMIYEWWQNDPTVQGKNTRKKLEKTTGDKALDVLDKSGLIGGWYFLIDLMFNAYDAIVEGKPWNLKPVEQKLLGIPVEKPLEVARRVPLLLSPDTSDADRASGLRGVMSMLPLSGAPYIKPAQSALVDWLLRKDLDDGKNDFAEKGWEEE